MIDIFVQSRNFLVSCFLSFCHIIEVAFTFFFASFRKVVQLYLKRKLKNFINKNFIKNTQSNKITRHILITYVN